MKFMVIGDFHGKFPKNLKKEAKKVDFILCVGDFGGSDKLLKIIFKHFTEKWYKKVGKEKAKRYVLEDYTSGKRVISELDKIGKKVFIIPGNWDFTNKGEAERMAGLNLKKYNDLVKDKKNLQWWNRGLKSLHGLKILAFGGYVPAGAYLEKNGIFKGKKRLKHLRKNIKNTKQLMSFGKNDLDILLAHYPPYGYFDVVKFKGENPMNGKHVGFKGYTAYIKKHKPKIFIFGHMHEYQGITKLGKTLIITTGSAKEGKAVILEINNKEKLKVRFIKP